MFYLKAYEGVDGHSVCKSPGITAFQFDHHHAFRVDDHLRRGVLHLIHRDDGAPARQGAENRPSLALQGARFFDGGRYKAEAHARLPLDVLARAAGIHHRAPGRAPGARFLLFASEKKEVKI